MNEHLENSVQTTSENKPETYSGRIGDRSWTISISLLIIATLITIISQTVGDADLWGHLQFGMDILDSGTITQVDPYSYMSAGYRWINHEWLAEVLFALLWRAGGSSGLIILKTLVGLFTFGSIYFYLINLNLSPIRAGSLIILASLAVIPAIATVRPHMFTLLFSVLTFLIIAAAEYGKYKWLWLCPLVFALWVNFHGGVLAGIGFLLIWAIIHTLLHRQEWLKILIPTVVSVFAVLINPYGTDLITFLLETATIPRPEIVEWQALQPVSILGAIYFILLSIAILAVIFCKIEKRIPLLVLLAVAAIMPFVAVRHLPLFAFAVLIFGGPFIADAWLRFTKSSGSPSGLPRVVIVSILLLSFGLLIFSLRNFQTIKMPKSDPPFFPEKGVAILDESEAKGNLATEFNWGEYAIWYLSPNIKVSMDGRRETVYSEEKYQIYNSFVYGINNWDSLLDDFDTNIVLIARYGPVYNLLKLKGGWELVYEDATSALFVSKENSHIARIKEAISNLTEFEDDGIFP